MKGGETGRVLHRFTTLYPCQGLDGRQPHDLTVQQLWRDLPANWTEQRERLGFPSPTLR